MYKRNEDNIEDNMTFCMLNKYLQSKRINLHSDCLNQSIFGSQNCTHILNK